MKIRCLLFRHKFVGKINKDDPLFSNRRCIRCNNPQVKIMVLTPNTGQEQMKSINEVN